MEKTPEAKTGTDAGTTLVNPSHVSPNAETPPVASDSPPAPDSHQEGLPDEDIIAEIHALSCSKTAELKSKFTRLDRLIGDSHWLSVGSYKESILRNQLRETVPGRFTVGTGFTFSVRRDQPNGNAHGGISKQTDILIWDSSEHAPLFRDGDFVVIPSHACRAAVEVKGNLNHAALTEGLANLDAVVLSMANLYDIRRTGLYLALFAYELDDEVKFPKTILNALHKLYASEPDWRQKWSRSPDPHSNSERLPWIDAIVVRGHGVISLVFYDVNGVRTPAYVTRRPFNPAALDDTYGFMERGILASLRVLQHSTGLGGYGVNVAGEINRRGFGPPQNEETMLVGIAPRDVKKLGTETDPTTIKRLLYKPRKTRAKETKPRKSRAKKAKPRKPRA